MTKEELIKILDGYEVFIDDDWGGSYKSIISYAPDKSVSRAHTSLGALEIIDAFDKMQKDKQELINYLKEQINICDDIIKSHTKEINGVVNISDNNMHIILIRRFTIVKDTYKEILNKIEKSNK